MNINIREIKTDELLNVAKLDAEVWISAYNKNFSKKIQLSSHHIQWLSLILLKCSATFFDQPLPLVLALLH